MCVIDQAIAFMGGLDLCFGRYAVVAAVEYVSPTFESLDGILRSMSLWMIPTRRRMGLSTSGRVSTGLNDHVQKSNRFKQERITAIPVFWTSIR